MIKYLLLGIGVLVNTAAWSFPYERVKSCFYAAEQGCSADVSILMSSQVVSVFSNVSEKPLLMGFIVSGCQLQQLTQPITH